jgi:hypothetical protein
VVFPQHEFGLRQMSKLIQSRLTKLEGFFIRRILMPLQTAPREAVGAGEDLLR